MPRPCDPTETSGGCPFRIDTPAGEFPAERYEILAHTAGQPGVEAPVDAPMFACHHTADGAPVACAGWLAVCGVDHLGIRFAVSDRRLDAAALRRPDGVELFATYDEMATQQSAGMYRPEAAAASRDAAGHNAPFMQKVLGAGQLSPLPTGCPAEGEWT